MPMPSRSVRPAGNRHSCGDPPLMLRAGHAGYPPGMREAAARCSPGGGAGGCLRPKRQVRWALRLCALQGEAAGLRGADGSMPPDIGVPGKPGRGRPQPGRMPGSAMIPGTGNGRARTGLCAPRTAPPSGGAGTGRRDQHRDGRSVTAADNTGCGPLRPARRGHRSPRRFALPRPRDCGGRSCSFPRWPSARRYAVRCLCRG